MIDKTYLGSLEMSHHETLMDDNKLANDNW